MKSGKDNQEIWDEHWTKEGVLGKLILEEVFSYYRKTLIATQVRIYVDQYFPRKGTFLELGSGTSESSSRIPKRNRVFGAVDFSSYALSRARKISIIDFCIQADIFKLPLKDASLDGIWNVGVMEHFTYEELLDILKEFNRVLRKNSYCVLFWPWVLAPSHIIFSFYEKLLRIIGIYKQIFPKAYSMFRRRRAVEEIMIKAGFIEVKFYPPLLDFTHWVVVGRK